MEQKLAIALCLTLLATTGLYYQEANESDELYLSQFQMWRQAMGRRYTTVEESFRFTIFKSNLQVIEEHNKLFDENQVSFELGLNQFADLANDEFNFRFLTLKVTEGEQDENVFTGEGAVTNEAVDWRQNGAVTDVKNQGQCGSCWAFSATGALEGHLFIRDGALTLVSEQELVDCAGGKYQNEGCNGGYMNTAFQYVADNGISTESAYPYTGRDGKCKQNVQPRNTIQGYKNVQQSSEAALKAAITQQPVSVAIDASSLWFQFYRNGVFDGKCKTNLNHGVLAVGYGTQNNKDYWIVKNSWGRMWGDGGYIKMVQNGDGHGQCGILDEAAFPI